ncbi:unnamed protein product [Linum tenue]|uniref:Rhamnogalacturonase A/B/Epimerase-like pectate lyase domain-containing protein n=1 Tax=Linum tenue TaxID=586396 RepID=A0AAV0PGV3_9ROSI|nr:unnamed protein product [Linum tenue]
MDSLPIKFQVKKNGVWMLLLLAALMAASTESRKAKVVDSFEYIAMNCRAHSASITEFGAVGDGKTSNTKAFKDAVDHLGQFSSDGGSQLYVPAGKWLTGSFSVVSHFTLFLHQDAVLLASQSGVRIKTAVGRGGFVKDIYVRRMTMHTMKWAFWMTGNYGSHADKNYDPNALPVIQNINYRDMAADNVSMAARLEGIAGDPFTQICISNVTIGMAAKAKKVPWTCSDVGGITAGVSPRPCDLLPEQGPGKMEETLPIDSVELKTCSYKINY